MKTNFPSPLPAPFPSELEQALDLARRLTEYTPWRSMRALRKAIRAQLKARGLEDQLRRFKLVQGGDAVNVYVRD